MPPSPPLPPPKDRSALLDLLLRLNLRTALQWSALVVMFLVLQVLFSRPAGQRELSGGLGAVAATLCAFVIGFTVRNALLARQARRAVAAAQAGDEAKALALYRALESRAFGPQRQAARLNLAYLLFHQGELDEGLRFLGLVEGSHGRLPGDYGQTVADRLALGLALRGDLEAAEGWLAQARRRTPGAGLVPARLHLVAEAIVVARRGDAPQAHRRLSEAWAEVERGTSAVQLRPLHVVRAFLATAVGTPLSAEVAEAAAGARAHAWLGAAWPELAAWIAAQPSGA